MEAHQVRQEPQTPTTCSHPAHVTSTVPLVFAVVLVSTGSRSAKCRIALCRVVVPDVWNIKSARLRYPANGVHAPRQSRSATGTLRKFYLGV
jgi:hypothetical protein